MSEVGGFATAENLKQTHRCLLCFPLSSMVWRYLNAPPRVPLSHSLQLKCIFSGLLSHDHRTGKDQNRELWRHVSFRNKLKHQSHHADMNQIPTPVSLMLFATCLCLKSEMSDEKEKPREWRLQQELCIWMCNSILIIIIFIIKHQFWALPDDLNHESSAPLFPSSHCTRCVLHCRHRSVCLKAE